jgi:hypothetical protein
VTRKEKSEMSKVMLQYVDEREIERERREDEALSLLEFLSLYDDEHESRDDFRFTD